MSFLFDFGFTVAAPSFSGVGVALSARTRKRRNASKTILSMRLLTGALRRAEKDRGCGASSG
ncbi:hypothetical protein PHISCL_10234 [Aspergillus sclerotialis]|uniref:Uncharacterized protein n=1 Tax=Aspergillus sclerotialis TaxID=2070753 RepID=A0A3A2Z326_9EURO|nr:hypothetical protein PHISCL_10234 [Aspergillus sclerotialis]